MCSIYCFKLMQHTDTIFAKSCFFFWKEYFIDKYVIALFVWFDFCTDDCWEPLIQCIILNNNGSMFTCSLFFRKKDNITPTYCSAVHVVKIKGHTVTLLS